MTDRNPFTHPCALCRHSRVYRSGGYRARQCVHPQAARFGQSVEFERHDAACGHEGRHWQASDAVAAEG